MNLPVKAGFNKLRSGDGPPRDWSSHQGTRGVSSCSPGSGLDGPSPLHHISSQGPPFSGPTEGASLLLGAGYLVCRGRLVRQRPTKKRRRLVSAHSAHDRFRWLMNKCCWPDEAKAKEATWRWCHREGHGGESEKSQTHVKWRAALESVTNHQRKGA